MLRSNAPTRCSLIALALAIAGVGCGPVTPRNDTTLAKNAWGQTTICREERPIGSSIPRRVCRTQDTINRDRANSKDFVNSTRLTIPRRR
jgi:hypothetical protein